MPKPIKKYSDVKVYPKLTNNSVAEEYCKTLEQMYTDIISVPMFNDQDTMIEEWGIEFFHKEAQGEVAWTVITCLMSFINNTGHMVSHVIENEEFGFYAQIQEKLCLGQEATIYKDIFGITEIITDEDYND
jgi:hypothetical protein